MKYNLESLFGDLLMLVIVVTSALALSACSSVPPEGLCYKNNMYYSKNSPVCGEDLISYDNDPVNVNGNFVEIK